MLRETERGSLAIRFQSRNKDSVGTLARDIMGNNLVALFVHLENLSNTDFNSNGQICLVEGILKQHSIHAMT